MLDAHEVRNLAVLGGSTFCNTTGDNPTETIEAIADRSAQDIAEHFDALAVRAAAPRMPQRRPLPGPGTRRPAYGVSGAGARTDASPPCRRRAGPSPLRRRRRATEAWA